MNKNQKLLLEIYSYQLDKSKNEYFKNLLKQEIENIKYSNIVWLSKNSDVVIPLPKKQKYLTHNSVFTKLNNFIQLYKMLAYYSHTHYSLEFREFLVFKLNTISIKIDNLKKKATYTKQKQIQFFSENHK